MLSVTISLDLLHLAASLLRSSGALIALSDASRRLRRIR